MYDTVDQAALRRVDVRERTADATVYRKVDPDRADPAGPGGRAGRSIRGGAPGRDGRQDTDGMTALTPVRRRDGRRSQPVAGTARMAAPTPAREASARTGTGRRPGGHAGPGRTGPGRAADGTARAEMGGPPSGPGRGGRMPRPGQGRRGPMWWRRRPRWLRRLVLAGFFSGLLLFVAGLAVIYAATRVPLPGEVKTDQTSIIYYSSAAGSNKPGDEIARIGTVNRTDVPLAQVSKDMQHAVLAAEDKNFYHEPGISPRGIARALYVNLTGGDLQGGSTITQQYAKNAYLSQERTFTRKMREIVLAVKLGQKYSKDQILEYYLNTIYFGRGAYGIEAAAKAYYNTTAANLTASQGAVIAGLIRSPNYLDPAKNPAPAATRWHEVVATMVAQGWAPAALAQQSPPPVMPKAQQDAATSSAQVAYIRDEVKAELKTAGITDDQINQGGLRITTTIDQGRQMASYQAVTNVLSSAYSAVPDLRTGLAAIEPGTGRILAYYAGTSYDKNYQFDTVTKAGVQAGSTFKAITLVAALQNNINLKSVFRAPPVTTLPPNYVVHNDEGDGVDFGYKNLIQSLALSINTVYVPLGHTVGEKNVIDTARAMGIPASTVLKNEAGVTLGQDDVHPIDMTAVYATLASNGVHATPHMIDKVVDGTGQVIYSGSSDAKQAIPATVARDATYALQSVITDPGGTGTAAKLGDGREAAGKTGTSTDFRSAWFCGYTKELASCVDMYRGGGTNSEVLKGIPGAKKGVYGGTFPAKVWKAFMDAALQGVPQSHFDPPAYGGLVQDNEPPPTPTPTPTLSPSATAGQSGGIDIGNLFPSADANGNGGGSDSGAGGGQQSGNQPRRSQQPPGGGGIVVNPFG